MFGKSEDRRRIEIVEKVASEARDGGIKALAEIARHTGECNIRQANRVVWEGEVKDMLRWMVRGIVTILLGAAVGLLGAFGRAKGLF